MIPDVHLREPFFWRYDVSDSDKSHLKVGEMLEQKEDYIRSVSFITDSLSYLAQRKGASLSAGISLEMLMLGGQRLDSATYVV